MRRANGTGSVYKMTHKNLRKLYRAVITLYQDEIGRVIRKTVGTFRTAKEAQECLKNYNGNPAEFTHREVTFEQCFDWMVADKKRKGVGTKSLAGYSTAKGKMATLLKLPIKDIRIGDLQAVIDGAKAKSPSAMRQIMLVFNGVYNAALKNDIDVKNYAKFIILPTPPEKDKIHKPYMPDEIIALWGKDDILSQMQLIYIYTGMRPAELYNQEVDKIYLAKRYMIGGSKTDAGKNRVIPIADCIANIIADLYAQAKFKRLTTLDGLLPAMHKLRCQLKKHNHLPHDGRHTFATLAANAKIDHHCIKLIMGHSLQKDITLDIYTHKNTQQLIDAVNTIPDKKGLSKVVQWLCNKENKISKNA